MNKTTHVLSFALTQTLAVPGEILSLCGQERDKHCEQVSQVSLGPKGLQPFTLLCTNC